MAVYQPNTNWDDVNARGGVTGTTTAPTLSSSDPNAETANTDWSQVLDRGGVTGTTTPPTTTSANNDAGIAAAYQKYLGRGVTAPEYDYWRNNGSYEQGIAASPEAQAYATRAAMVGGPGWTRTAADPTLDRAQVEAQIRDEFTRRGLPVDEAAVQYYLGKALQPDIYSDYKVRVGWNPYLAARMINRSDSEDPRLAGDNGVIGYAAQTGASGGGQTSGATAFSDPATSQWESLVRQLTDRLNNPMPDSAKELQQTQALDPLERQRQTMKDQTAQRLSQRGITPTSGTWDEAMREVDRQFNELRTRTQAGFANSWAQNEDNRMLQAANLFKQIPQYQDARLTLAQNTLIPTNVGSLLQMQQQGNQWDAQQQQAFWTALAKSISDLLNR